MEDTRLAKVTEKDLDWARDLRNNNRGYFFDTSELTEVKMKAWFDSLKNRPKFRFYKIMFNNERVGTISISTEKHGGKAIEIGHVLIDEKYRHQGIFTKVMAILEERYNKPFCLEVRVDNERAVQTYKKLGFKINIYRMWKEHSTK